MAGGYLVIVNPAAGSGRTKRRWAALAEDLATLGVDAQVALTAGPNDATRLTREYVRSGGREVIVFGGDGTIGETVAGFVDEAGEGVLAEGITLSVVHQGTGGDLARGLGIPRNASKALATIVNGTTREIDLGVARFQCRSGGGEEVRAFVSSANVGMGADVVEQVTGKFKKFGNSAAFAIASINSILKVKPKRMVFDGATCGRRELDVLEVMIGNNRFMGGGMIAAPDALIDDGELDVVVVKPAGKVKLVTTFPKIYKGTHMNESIVELMREPAFTIDMPDDPQGVVLDGEFVGRTPVHFRVLHRAIRVRVP